MSNDQALLDFYTPPTSLAVESPNPKLNFLGTDGRIGRLRYIAWLTVGFIAITGGYFLFASLFVRFFIRNELISHIGEVFVFLGGGYLLLIVLYIIRCSMQRLQDFNCNKWLALIMVVPLVNILLVAFFMIIPGNATDNNYGPPPLANSKIVIILASLFFFAIGFLLIIFTW